LLGTGDNKVVLEAIAFLIADFTVSPSGRYDCRECVFRVSLILSIEFAGLYFILSDASSFLGSRGLRVKAFLSTSCGIVSMPELNYSVSYLQYYK